MIILDTNVVSEVFKPTPDPAVGSWLGMRPQGLYFLTAITKAELLFGLACMPHGKRKRDLADVMWKFFEEKVPNPILTFDGNDAEQYADILAVRQRMGELDAQIAAIARSRNYAVATRDIQGFEECGVELINPWEFAA
jgi:toxin FitB